MSTKKGSNKRIMNTMKIAGTGSVFLGTAALLKYLYDSRKEIDSKKMASIDRLVSDIMELEDKLEKEVKANKELVKHIKACNKELVKQKEAVKRLKKRNPDLGKITVLKETLKRLIEKKSSSS